jgi:two-component system, NtrC family, sensor kinase
MNTFPVPFKTVVTIMLTVLVVTIGVLNLRDRASWRDPSDGVFWMEEKSGLLAAEVDPAGPGAQAGIHAGDRLLALNGKLLANLGEYSDELYRVGPGQTLLYGLAAGADIREIPLQLAARTLLQPKDGLRVVLAFLYLLIGAFVIIRGAHLARSGHFFLICLAAFVLYLFSYTPRWGGLDQTVYTFSVAALLVLPALFVHFCLRFPMDPKPLRTRAPLFYAPAALLGMVHALWLTGHLAKFGLPLNARSIAILDRIHLVYLCAGLLTGGIILLRRKMSSRDLTMRQQMKWVSYGTLAGTVPFVVIYVLPALIGVRPNFAMLSSQLFLAVIPLSFGYAILHFRLLDVEAIARRSAAYLGASSLLLALYLVFVLVLGKWLESIVPEANFIVICVAALTIAMMFAPLRNSIQSRLDRIFYKENFDDRASLLDFARTLTTEVSVPRLTRKILERMSKTFQLNRVALFLADAAKPGSYRLADALGFPVPGVDGWVVEEGELDWREHPSGPAAEESSHQLRRAHPALAAKDLQYLQDLKVHGRRIGVIGLGPLPEHQHFSTEDLALLDALAGYAGIALENANLYRSIETKAVELERLKIYTENIIESINIAVLALDLDGRITSCNRAFEELYRMDRGRVVGSGVDGLLGQDIVASIQKVTGVSGWDIKAPGNIFKLYVPRQDGQNLFVNLSIIPLLDTADRNSGCLIVMDDISEKVQLEDQLLQAEKLSSIGLLAAGIAHEVNTPITGISSYAQMLLKNTPADDVRKPLLEKIEKQTFRAAEIVNGLLNFARLNGSEYTDLDLNQLIRESLDLLDHQFKQNHVEVLYSPGGTIPKIYGNAGKLQQVFVNLFLNARDAMPSGGTLKIETSKNDTMVVVDIYDSGMGISAENIRKIYDPFFTTKSTGKGTGLGLAVTYGIVQEHGGRILVDSTPTQGTHFRLKLPTRHSLQ